MLNPKVKKKLSKLKESEEYKQAYRPSVEKLGTKLEVEPHHRRLYWLFLSHATGELASALRAQRTQREPFQVVLEPNSARFKFSRKTEIHVQF